MITCEPCGQSFDDPEAYIEHTCLPLPPVDPKFTTGDVEYDPNP